MNGLDISRFPGGGSWHHGGVDARTVFYVPFELDRANDRSMATAIVEINRDGTWVVDRFEASRNGRMATLVKGDDVFSRLVACFNVALWDDDLLVARALQAVLGRQLKLASTRHWSYQKPVHAMWLRVYKAELAKVAANIVAEVA